MKKKFFEVKSVTTIIKTVVVQADNEQEADKKADDVFANDEQHDYWVSAEDFFIKEV